MIKLVICLIILFKTIEKGGDWFDFLDGNARFDNSLAHFQFGLFFWALVIGFLVLAYYIFVGW